MIVFARSNVYGSGSGCVTKTRIWQHEFRSGGSVAYCVDKLGELVRAGAQHLLLNPVFDYIEHMELLAAEVLPHL